MTVTVLTPSLEDYLEAIWRTGLTKKVVRVKDIAKALKVATASVVAALKNLAGKKLVVHEKYGYVELTDKGVTMAKQIYDKHKTLTRFFSEFLGVNTPVASRDACQIEHYISRVTVERMVSLMKFIETMPDREHFRLSDFHRFVETQESTTAHTAKQRRKKEQDV